MDLRPLARKRAIYYDCLATIGDPPVKQRLPVLFEIEYKMKDSHRGQHEAVTCARVGVKNLTQNEG